MKLIIAYIAGVLIILAVLILTSCNTTKYVERVKMVYDSTAIKELEIERKLSKRLREENEKLKTDSSGISIQFEPLMHPNYRPLWSAYPLKLDSLPKLFTRDDSLTILSPQGIINPNHSPNQGQNLVWPYYVDWGNKITIKQDGTIEASGNIKSVNLNKKTIEADKRNTSIDLDSTAKEKQVEAANVSKEQENFQKNVKRRWSPPWWLVIVGFIIGCIFWHFRYRIPFIGTFLKFINGRFFNSIPPRT